MSALLPSPTPSPTPIPTSHQHQIMASAAEPAPLLRKNGKPQSCEPCRKSKLSCDHKIPCGRCARLRRSEQCVYDPSPAKTASKKRRISAGPVPSPGTGPGAGMGESVRNSESQDSMQASLITLKPAGLVVMGPPPYPPTPSDSNASRPGALTAGIGRKTSVKYRPGFMGHTAYSAILAEYEPTLGQSLAEVSTTASPVDQPLDIDPACLELGARILSCLPSEDLSRQAISHYFQRSVAVSIHMPTLWHFHESFFATYGKYLQAPRDPRRLLEASSKITRHALQNPFPSSFASDQDYLNALTDRWELLGTLFCCFASIAQILSPSHELIKQILPPNVPGQDFARNMLECAESCLRLVDLLDTGLNVWVAFLSYRSSALLPFVGHSGDTNYAYWRRNVQLCGDMTALGFHRLPKYPSPLKLALMHTEQQKRMFATAFTHDKHLAVFLGRPPSLSKRYVTTHELLDVSDDDLISGNIQKIRESLDEYGYNKGGRIYRSTSVRAFYILSLIYEDILEISLGAAQVDYNRVRSVKADLAERIRQQPAQMHEVVNRELFHRMPNLESFAVVEVQLINLHQQFLLDRIENGTEHLDFGLVEEMLRIVLVFWAEREQYPGHEDEYVFERAQLISATNGQFAATAFPQRLPWRSASGKHRKTARGAAPAPIRFRISVSSLLVSTVGHLVRTQLISGIKPIDGNYELCQRTMRMLKGILDRVLDPGAVPGGQVPASSSESDGSNFMGIGSAAAGAGAAATIVDPLGGWDLATFSVAGMPNFGMGVNGLDVDDLFSSEWMHAPRANFR